MVTDLIQNPLVLLLWGEWGFLLSLVSRLLAEAFLQPQPFTVA